MTPTHNETRRRAAAAVSAILAFLENDTAAGLIDQPIDGVLERFRLQWSGPVTAEACHRVFGQLVRAIVNSMRSRYGSSPDAWWCRDAALGLLELGYRGTNDNGYDGALDDVLHPSDPLLTEGIDGVLIQLASLVKARLREMYAQSVFARFLDPCDPGLRLAIVAEIQHRHGDLLPADIQQAQPYGLVGQIPELLAAIHDARQLERHLALSAFEGSA